MRVRRLMGLAVLCTAGMFAAEPVSAYRAQLTGPNGNALNGILVTAGDQLVFVDSAQPSLSFAIPRRDLQSLTLVNNGAIVARIARPYTGPFGQANTLTFMLPDQSDQSALAQWIGMPINGMMPQTDNNGYVVGQAQTPATLSYSAKHDDDQGRLVVGPTGVDWVDISNQSKSRHWDYSQIKGVDRDDSDQIKVKPYNGDEFTVKTSPTVRDSAYNAIATRMATAVPVPR